MLANIETIWSIVPVIVTIAVLIGMLSYIGRGMKSEIDPERRVPGHLTLPGCEEKRVTLVLGDGRRVEDVRLIRGSQITGIAKRRILSGGDLNFKVTDIVEVIPEAPTKLTQGG